MKFVKDEAETAKSFYTRFIAQKPKAFKIIATYAMGVEEELTETKRCYLCFRVYYRRDCFEFCWKPLNQGSPLCEKINCVIIVLSKDTLLGFAETLVYVRWKDVNGNIHFKLNIIF